MSGTPAPELTPSQARAILQAVLATLRITARSPAIVQPGDPLRASLVPASPQINASELVNGVLNVALLTKDAAFNDLTVANLPESGDLSGDTLLGSIPVPGVGTVQGMLGQLFGTVGIPNLKVRLEVRWIVRDQAGQELHEEGGDLIATDGMTSPNLSVLIPPLFGELRIDTLTSPPIPDVYCLSADVRLSLGDVTLPAAGESPIELPAVPFAVARLLIPTIVVLYTEPFFDVAVGGTVNDNGDIEDLVDSAVVVVVPEHSPFASAAALFDALRKIERALDGLRSIGGIASFLLPLGDIVSIPEQPRFRFSASDAIARFHDITLKPKKFFGFTYGYKHFDDRVYSIVVVGLPGTVVEFFNDVDFRLDQDQGFYALRVGAEGFVVVRTLDTSDEDPPVTLPPGRVSSFVPDTSSGSDGRWHTDMSSMRFAPGWLAGTGDERKGPPNLTCLGLSVGADVAVQFGLDVDLRNTRVTAINNGPANATGVVAKVIASGAFLEDRQVSQGQLSGPEDMIRWDLGDLATGVEATLQFLPSPTAFSWSIEASIIANELDLDPSNNRSELEGRIGG